MEEEKIVEFLVRTYKKYAAEASSMKEAVYITLKEGILMDQLGEEITENQVASILSLSRTPVREAMHMLVGDGLLEISHGRKAKILKFSRQDAADISLMLRTLHVLAAELFIDNAKDADIQKLGEKMALASFYQERNDIHKMAVFLTEFHASTALACGNKWLADTITRLLSLTAFHREYALSRPGRAAVSIKEHMAILDALSARDKDTARALLSHHVDSAFDPQKFRELPR